LPGDVVEAYKQSLGDNSTLCVFDNETLLFSDKGRWLNPLFSLEKFLATYKGSRDNLFVHDTAAGKAAAVLMVRFGVKKAHINLISELAINYYQNAGVTVSWEKKVDKLACMTETLLEPMQDSDEMYRILRIRANLVEGVSVEATQASFSYGQKKIFENLTFSIPQGGHLLVRGGNGNGKTTLIKTILGKLELTGGSILVDGRPPTQLPGRTIGYIKQQQAHQQQFPVSACEVVSMAVDTKLSSERQKWEIDTSLRRTGVFELRYRNFYTLSGGEQQKVSLARCLCQKARLLLLDEPTSFLDTESRGNLLDIIQSLSVGEMPTIIMVSHDKEIGLDLLWPTLELGENHG
jgi:zinc transport system ATP-binding protein